MQSHHPVSKLHFNSTAEHPKHQLKAPFPTPEATEAMHLAFPKLTQMCGF